MKANHTIDATLVNQYQSGNKQALAELVKRWHKSFCKKAYWIVKDKEIAKDIAQDSWGIIMKQIQNIKEPEKFGAWASRIVYNKALDWTRVNAKERKKNSLYGNEQQVYEEDKKEDYPIQKKLLESIKKLPSQQQNVIQLFYLEEYSIAEIGHFLGISTGTVKSRLFHSREKLKKIIKNKSYDK